MHQWARCVNNTVLCKLELSILVQELSPKISWFGMKLLNSETFSRIWVTITGFIRGYQRFLIPICLVIAARLIGSLVLFNLLHLNSGQSYWMTVNWTPSERFLQNTVLRALSAQGVRWPFLYLGWDSAWYLTIVTRGYGFLDQSYAFFPGLPLFTYLLNLGLNNPTVSIVAVTSIFGALWIPIFQLVAETYADAHTSLRATVTYALFPYVFLFTTVAYSEGIFMFFTLLSWYFFRKKAIIPSMCLLAIAVLSRPPGLLLMLPILAMIIYSWVGQNRNFSLRGSRLWLLLPFVSFFLLLQYSQITIGNWFAIGTRTAWNSMPSFASFVVQAAQGKGFGPMYLETVGQLPYSAVWILFLVAAPLMLKFLFNMDRWLWLYSAVFLIPVLIGGALLSLPRFISFIFPLWLAVELKAFKSEKTKYILPLIAALSLVVGVLLWSAFIQGEFIA